VGHDQSRFVTDTPEPDEAGSLEDLMARFRSNADGATARFAPVEAAIIRDLVGQVIELIGADGLEDADAWPADDAPTDPTDPTGRTDPTDPADRTGTADTTEAGATGAGAPGRRDGMLDGGPIDADALAAMVGFSDNTELPDDPVLARLLPDAYRDDPDASGEFRRYTESGLRSGKAAAARTVLATLPPAGGRIRLSEPEAQAWLRALNDVRLALGVRLEVTDDFDDQVANMEPDDPRASYIGVYQWLAFLQETLVRALS
jgi:Domain of unknown function (DUF2017)